MNISITRSSYPVVGSTVGELRAVIEALGHSRGSGTFAAFTDWEVAWDYSIEGAAGEFRATVPRVGVRATITIPRWRPPRSAALALREQWCRYLAAIELHEQGHVALAIEAGRGVITRLEGLPLFADAQALRRAADAAARAAIAAARARENVYDEETGHGATQGARFPHAAPVDRQGEDDTTVNT
jgi:predicted secreted Zn-dependent protease